MDGLSGGEGARAMAEYLDKRKLSPCFVLDYGGYATNAAFCRYLPQGAPLALIGITEKGQLEGRVIAPTVPDVDDRNAARPLHLLLRSGSRLGIRARRASLCPASVLMLAEIARHAPLFPSLLIHSPWLTFPLLRALWRRRAIMAQFCERADRNDWHAGRAFAQPHGGGAYLYACHRARQTPGALASQPAPQGATARALEVALANEPSPGAAG